MYVLVVTYAIGTRMTLAPRRLVSELIMILVIVTFYACGRIVLGLNSQRATRKVLTKVEIGITFLNVARGKS